MRIVFAGTPDTAVPTLRALHQSGHEIVGVLTREDAPLGRKRVLTASPVADAAAELGMPLFKANQLDDEATAWVSSLSPELGVVVAYGGLIREPLLSLPSLGWINLHFSDLPRWRGAAPVQRALMAGERRLHVSVFRLVKELDAGPVLARDSREFPIGTSAGAALSDLAEFGTLSIDRAIERLAEDPGSGEAQEGESSYAQKLSRDDGALDLHQATESLVAQWAGVTPEPGAFARYRGEPVKILELAPDLTEDSRDGNGITGEVLLDSGRAMLTLGDGRVELIRVQPAGKPPMEGAAWLRGRASSGEPVILE